VPVLGWNMTLNGYIRLKRGNLPSIMRMFRTCLARLRTGHSLFVFPEGTRSPNGDLIPFYPGAFRIAARSGIPIVPVVIEGTAGILPKGSFRITPRRVVVQILDPIPPDEVAGNWRRLRDLTRARMSAELDRLRGR
jgi:1-acyl-sn-glycerol-3-phosphate acyltransferase